ncbi:MAG TPA: O-antigen ligase family protein [Gemmatimonadales bacterium]|jgi:O-antigen ligase|nr:O-antigen ligase family protein [Gemmatimonadales bacterium]
MVVLWLGLVIAMRRGADGRWLWPDPFLLRSHLWLFVAYGIGFTSAVRLYGSLGVTTAGREVARVASIVLAFLVVLWWVADRRGRERLGWQLLFLGAVPPLALATWQLLQGTGNLELEGVNRLQGTLSHPNSFGLYLVPFALFLVGGIPSSRGVRTFARVGAALTLSVFIVLSYSRTALLALVAGLMVLPFLGGRRSGWRTVVTTGTLALVLAGGVWIVAGDLVRERFASLSVNRDAWDAALLGESENSLTWRLINWGVLIQLGFRHPISGHGAGMTTELNPLVSPVNGIPFNAHNDFVRFFFEGGFSGLFAYVIYALTLCAGSIRAARKAPRADAALAFGVSAAFASLLILSLGSAELSLNTAILYELYAMLALVWCTSVGRAPRPQATEGRDAPVQFTPGGGT